jgi:hypothetical protein
MAEDVVLFPHCDLHVALNGTPDLHIRVMARDFAPGNMSFTLSDVTSQCTFDFFAPYNAVGSRLHAFVSIDPATGRVTPNAVGINLIQIRFPDPAFGGPNNIHAIVARIQVHDNVVGWWFGNSSITTARHGTIATAQPSIYALFSTDASGTDVVGDITGHGFVTLTSLNAGVFNVSPEGRLRGIATGNGTLNGNFLGTNRTLPVKVVDYAAARQTLQRVRSADHTNPQSLHNVLFLAEGFRDTDADRERFDEIVTEVVDEIFSKPRHAPYDLLGNSFNIWKAFETSVQHGVTCAFRVTDEATDDLSAGHPIPSPEQASEDETKYELDALVPIVGLPLRTESRTPAQLKALWSSQSLHDYDDSRVDAAVANSWKVQRSVGILEARDTFFGLHLSKRFADRGSRFGAPVPPPGSDAPGAPLDSFVERVYEWFDISSARTLTLDPRRHPPELLMGNRESFGNLVLTYINGLHDAEAPHANVGSEWMPDPSNSPVFRRSRGLIAIIVNEDLIGGTNFNANTMTANTLNNVRRMDTESDNTGNRRIRRRTMPDEFDMDLQDVVDTVAHEFGHSFNLGDEYEEFVLDDPDAFAGDDNVTTLSAINLDASFMTNRRIDPSRVKWFDLVRIRVSDILTAPSAAVGSQMRVTIDPGQIGKWVEAKDQGLEAFLRHIDLPADGRQFPQPSDEAHHLVRLQIGAINESAGTILLGGPEMPQPPPVYPARSLLYIPVRDDEGQLVMVVEKKVLEKLEATNLPLNEDADRSEVNDEADHPVDVDDFKPPCKSYKLIGVYEGAIHATGMTYRPAGLCKMRKSGDQGVGDGEFCHVCKYLIVNRVDPGLHGLLDEQYPTAKKNG